MAHRNQRTQSEAGAAAKAAPPTVDAGRFSTENRRKLSGPGFRAFLAVADLWGLSEPERLMVLGLPARSTYFEWVSKVQAGRDLTLSVDALLRVSAILGVHKALRILFGGSRDEEAAWLRDPHDAPTFGGQPPMALLTNGTQDGIMLVRRYLDAFRGGVFAAPGAIDRDFEPYSGDDIVIV